MAVTHLIPLLTTFLFSLFSLLSLSSFFFFFYSSASYISPLAHTLATHGRHRSLTTGETKTKRSYGSTRRTRTSAQPTL